MAAPAPTALMVLAAAAAVLGVLDLPPLAETIKELVGATGEASSVAWELVRSAVLALVTASAAWSWGGRPVPVPVAVRRVLPGLLLYLAAYAATNLGAFAVVAEFPHAARPEDYRGLARSHPGLSVVLVVCLLGLVGTPPTAVFLGKLEVLAAAIDGGYAWLAVVNTVASLFYYLRWIVPAFLAQPATRTPLMPVGRWRWSALGAYTAGAVSLALGLAGGVVLPLGAGTLLP
ncbi:MAG: proton-conducting transporter membrane subunit [Pseudonocardiaceae bacterium]